VDIKDIWDMKRKYWSLVISVPSKTCFLATFTVFQISSWLRAIYVELSLYKIHWMIFFAINSMINSIYDSMMYNLENYFQFGYFSYFRV
jgi:hypothetical protein